MKIGGYQIIDLKGKKLTVNDGVVYEGIYDLIEGTNKVIIISGLVVGGVEYDDTVVECNVVGSNFECVLHGYKLTIQDSDVITISKLPNGIGYELIGEYEPLAANATNEIPIEENTIYLIEFNNFGVTDNGSQAVIIGERRRMLTSDDSNEFWHYTLDKGVNVGWYSTEGVKKIYLKNSSSAAASNKYRLWKLIK